MPSLWPYVVLSLISWAFGPIAEAAPKEDQIVNLPGLTSQPRFKQYSGYLAAIGGRQLHYWFIESEYLPATAPLVLWMNGGPGCSSVLGLLTEHGPFRINEDGKTLRYNDYSWNKVANMLYLEAPAGVGFSTTVNNNFTTDDDFTAQNNLAALISFFKKFPELKPNDFYITGESYGGIYVPTLSVLVLNSDFGFNFKGFAVGNGLHNYWINTNSAVLFAAFHGHISTELFLELTNTCCSSTQPVRCDFVKTKTEECYDTVMKASLAIASSGINEYNIYAPCKKSNEYASHLFSPSLHPINLLIKATKSYGAGFFTNRTLDTLNLADEPPCIDTSKERKWVNRDEVRQALHIPKGVGNWSACSDDVQEHYKQTYSSMAQQYEILLGKVRGLVYHGDIDAMCNFMQGEWFTDYLNLTVVDDYRPWSFQNQTAGFVKVFENLTYATVKGAGHMVPQDKPGPALKLFANFLYKKPIN